MSDDKTRARKPLDELGCMRRIGVLLAEQDVGAQMRILSWLEAKFTEFADFKPSEAARRVMQTASGEPHPNGVHDPVSNWCAQADFVPS